ncbi:hypothetical protein D3C81_1845270 [compost metagenome]
MIFFRYFMDCESLLGVISFNVLLGILYDPIVLSRQLFRRRILSITVPIKISVIENMVVAVLCTPLNRFVRLLS